jgi:ergothioneine biosynthesis protein EgtB
MHRDPSFTSPLARRYEAACASTDELFGIVQPAHIAARPIAERHRTIFYIGHLEAFDWNLLGKHGFCVPSYNPEFDRLFAFGIDPVGGGLPTDQPADWPSMGAINEYQARIRQSVSERLSAVNLTSDPGRPDGPGIGASADQTAGEPLENLLNVAIEHRLMHAETLAYMLHRLPLEHKIAVPSVGTSAAQRVVAGEMLHIPAGGTSLGRTPGPDGERPWREAAFGWDNEFGSKNVAVPAFDIDRFMVSNGDFLSFMDAGGYSERRFWRDADWAWKEGAGIGHPAFWERAGVAQDGWLQRTMFARIPLPLDWPVYVSHAEARAYACFAGKALPTEAQWQRAAEGVLACAPGAPGNFDFRSWDPVPVDAHPENRSVFGVQGQFGNGWEWTADEFAALPGFKPFPFYPGYSADFFDGRHYVLKGGSARTAACMMRPSFRNWFQPHYQFVYAGFRCVAGNHPL